MEQNVFGFSVQLRRPFDFGFLAPYGKPFCVFEGGASGNISFGLESERYGRVFAKFAGAPLQSARVSQEEAAHALEDAMPLYQQLFSHPALVRLLGFGHTGGGYLALYRFEEGPTLHDAADVLSLPPLQRLRMMEDMLDFHLFALSHGWMPVGLEDANLLVTPNGLKICDVDLYRPCPSRNDLGRMPGVSRYLAPEEYELGAVLDEKTAQYKLGALAFQLFAEGGRRDRAAWCAPEALFQVASAACSEEKRRRYNSFSAFCYAWRHAVGSIAL